MKFPHIEIPFFGKKAAPESSVVPPLNNPPVDLPEPHQARTEQLIGNLANLQPGQAPVAEFKTPPSPIENERVTAGLPPQETEASKMSTPDLVEQLNKETGQATQAPVTPEKKAA